MKIEGYKKEKVLPEDSKELKEIFSDIREAIIKEGQEAINELGDKNNSLVELIKNEQIKTSEAVATIEKDVNEIISAGFEEEVDDNTKKIIKDFDPLLEPLKHDSRDCDSFNIVVFCKHPKYGDVVFKYQKKVGLTLDFLEEKNTLLEVKSDKIDNIAKILDVYKNKDNREAFITERINGVNISAIRDGKTNFKLDGENILYKDKIITTKKEVQEKLLRAVEKLHSKSRAGFDIRSDNVLITPEGEPYLFDFDIQFSKKTASGELPSETFLKKALRQFLYAPKQLSSYSLVLCLLPFNLVLGINYKEEKEIIDYIFGLPNKKKIEEDLLEYKELDKKDILENLFKGNHSASLNKNLLERLPSDQRWK